MGISRGIANQARTTLHYMILGRMVHIGLLRFMLASAEGMSRMPSRNYTWALTGNR